MDTALDRILPDLICPQSRQPLHLANDEELLRVRQAIREKGLFSRGGKLVEEEPEAVLVCEDGKGAYGVWNSIPVLIVEDGFEMP
jgi:uncharacterized protein